MVINFCVEGGGWEGDVPMGGGARPQAVSQLARKVCKSIPQYLQT